MHWRPYIALAVLIAVAVAAGIQLAPLIGPLLVWAVVIVGFFGVLVVIVRVIDVAESRHQRQHFPPDRH